MPLRGTENVYRAIGERIRTTRISKKMVQADIANEAGLSRQSVANIERGRQRFMVHTLIDIARALGVLPAELLSVLADIPTEANLDALSPAARRFVLSVLRQSESA